MRRTILAFAITALLTLPSFCRAQTYTATQVNFYGYTAFDAGPNTGLIQASDGNFYGIYMITGDTGVPAIYKYTPPVTGFSNIAQSMTILHTQSGTDGDTSNYGSLIQGTDGNFYGTTIGGGANAYGSVFKLTPTGTFSTIYSFCSLSFCADGTAPAGLILGSDGNFYGTTSNGGTSTGGVFSGNNGTVFQLTPSGKLTTLHSFCSQTSCTDGDIPSGGLVEASDGNFYGTTEYGGTNAPPSGSYGAGVLYRITPSGSYSIIYDFCSEQLCEDGYFPYPNTLMQFTDGTLYGIAPRGEQDQGYGALDLFSITTAGVETIPAYFCEWGDGGGCSLNGGDPITPLWLGADGDLYSAVQSSQGDPETQEDGGVENITLASELPPPGYYFCQQTDCGSGYGPLGAVIQGADGLFYGVTDVEGSYPSAIYSIEFYRNSVPLSPPVVVTASSPNLTLGQSTTLSWKVNNAVSKTMQVCEGSLNGSPIEAVPLSGSYVYKPSAAGTYLVSITCGGVETGLVRLVVTKSATPTATTLTGPATTVTGQAFTLSGTISKQNGVLGVPTGTVTLKSSGESLATVPVQSNGAYSFSDSGAGIPSGTFSVTATYNGDGGDSASTSTPISIPVTKYASGTGVSAYPNPVPANQEVRLTATVYGISSGPTGSVSFSYAGTVLATASLTPGGSGTSTAQFTASTSGLSAGTYAIKASYSGDAYDQPSSGTVSVMVE